MKACALSGLGAFLGTARQSVQNMPPSLGQTKTSLESSSMARMASPFQIMPTATSLFRKGVLGLSELYTRTLGTSFSSSA